MYLLMERYESQSLKKIIHEMNELAVIQKFEQILKGMVAIHQTGTNVIYF